MALPSLYLSDIANVERTTARFWSYVDRTDDCWLWTGCVLACGYGYFSLKVAGRYKQILTHRMAFLLAHGDLPVDLCVLHHCDVRRCVRDSHLFVGTRADNWADATTKGRAHHPPHQMGSAVHNAKLTERDVREILQRYRAGESQASLARAFGVSDSAILRVRQGIVWQHAVADLTCGRPVAANHGPRPRCAKFSDDDVRAIRERHASGESLHALARSLGVARPTVTRIVKRTVYRDVD